MCPAVVVLVLRLSAPVPFESIERPMFVSDPVAASAIALPVADGVNVNPLAAVPATRAIVKAAIPDSEATKMF